MDPAVRAAIAAANSQEEQEPALTRFARENPAMSVLPISTLAGGTLGANINKRKPISGLLGGAVTGLGTGAGALLGGAIGKQLAPDSTGGMLGGGALGGLMGYLALHRLAQSSDDDEKEKRSVAPVLRNLLDTKRMSDQRDYAGKHRRLRALIEQNPDDFYIDSINGNIAGITHRPTGFQLHAPVNVLPANLHNATSSSEGVANEPAASV